MSVIEIRNLVKHYGRFKALDELEFEVNEGEVMGFIGPNGAGKTTTIRVLLGLLKRTSGTVNLFGKDAWHHSSEVHGNLAYVPDDVQLWPSLSGGEVIDLIGKLRGGVNKQRRDEMIQRFEFDPRKKCHTYSKGNRQKVALISAFSSDADLYILDEPTTGLDPLMESIFQECVLELKKQGKTVLLSSHILAVVEKLCDKVSIIRKGQIVESGTLDDLRHFTRNSMSIRTERPVAGLENLDGVYDLHLENDLIHFQIDSSKIDKVIDYLRPYGFRSLVSRPPTLEELFMHHYGDSLREGEKTAADTGGDA
ncbi:ABC transporter ATP-binding protein [Spirochaeta dissipatitropha]